MSDEYVHFNNNTQPAINEDNLNFMQQLIKQDINGAVSGDTLPLGAMIPFPGGTIPDNYLLCDGSAVSRTTYALLFNVIGTTYGAGDGSTTFNLPDMRSRTPVGVDTRDSNLNAVGKTYGEKKHTMTVSEMPEHSHPTQHYAVGTNARNYRAYEGGIASGQSDVYYATADTNNTGGSQPFNVMQPSMATNYIIKAFQTAGVVAQVVNEYSESTTNVYSTSYVNGIVDYSTTEKVCGTWIDGKPLYRKTINFGALPNNTTKSIAHNIQNLKRIWKLEGFAGSSINKGGIPLPYAVSTPVALYGSDTDVTVLTTSDRTAYTQTYIYVWYTKTTD